MTRFVRFGLDRHEWADEPGVSQERDDDDDDDDAVVIVVVVVVVVVVASPQVWSDSRRPTRCSSRRCPCQSLRTLLDLELDRV